MECLVYARVSTKIAKGQQDPEVQLLQLRKFAKFQGWKIVNEYIDEESGAKADRPAFKKMFEAAAKREFDVLLFWSL